jgi:hypothetical protein
MELERKRKSDKKLTGYGREGLSESTAQERSSDEFLSL